MSIDLSQFHQVFFEESLEGLDVMESALLNLDTENCDSETINEIFRAAHSIKGGSGTFGFSTVAEFTHVIETLLDQIRAGDRRIEPAHVELFLKSVDCIRQMIKSLEAGDAVEMSDANDLKSKFQAILDGKELAAAAPVPASTAPTAPASVSDTDAGSSGGAKTWHIYFKPDGDVLKTGNEPSRMFRELEDMGVATVVVDTADLPGIGVIDPETCYLKWNITLVADVEKAQIEEVFEWVIDEAELRIEEVAQVAVTENPEQNGAKPSSVKQSKVEPSDIVQTTVQSPVAEVSVSPAPSQAISAPAAKEPAAQAAPAAKKAEKNKTEVSSIRVGIDKVDSLINMVGELVITQSMLGELSRDFDISKLPKLLEGLEQLSQNTRELQESVMRIRMLPISFTFSRFPRLVHDLSKTMGKKNRVKTVGRTNRT